MSARPTRSTKMSDKRQLVPPLRQLRDKTGRHCSPESRGGSLAGPPMESTAIRRRSRLHLPRRRRWSLKHRRSSTPLDLQPLGMRIVPIQLTELTVVSRNRLVVRPHWWRHLRRHSHHGFCLQPRGSRHRRRRPCSLHCRATSPRAGARGLTSWALAPVRPGLSTALRQR